MTITEFRNAIRTDRAALVEALVAATGRSGDEEREAWNDSLPALSEALSALELGPMHLYVAGPGHLALEYQLPAASFWADVVLLGRSGATPSVVIIELKHCSTRGDRPGPVEGLMEHGGTLVLHPSEQVRGYTEYCRRFHSAVLEHKAQVRGCVLFTRDVLVDPYAEPPNDALIREYPCFSPEQKVLREAWSKYLACALDAPDERFAHDFVAGSYRQDRGFVRQIGALIRDCGHSPFELLDHQRRAFALVRARLEKNVFRGGTPRKQVIVIQGPPGSGKSVLAAHVWSALVTDGRLPRGSVVLTTTSTAQTSNWTKLFQNAAGARAASGVIKRAASYVPVSTQMLGRLRREHGDNFARDPGQWRSNVRRLRNLGVPFQDGARDEQFLVSVVDEAHALINPEHPEGRGQFGFAPTFGPLAWHIIRCSTVSIFLLDADQGFRDRENTTLNDIRRWAAELGADIGEPISLAGAQFRCAGSVEYVAWVEGLLAGQSSADLAALADVWRRSFDVRILETPSALERALREKAAEGRTVRLLASYARKWRTQGAAQPHTLPPALQDFHEPYVDETGKRQYWSKVWNFIPQNGSDYTWFIQAPPGSPMHADPLCEVGCPYAVRGFDFDFVGVLWLRDLVWRDGGWHADPAHVHDTGLVHSVRAALARAYRILLTRGLSGCYLWFEDSETRKRVRASLGQ